MEISSSALLRSSAGELRSTLGETLGAAISDPLTRPTEMLFETARQHRASGLEADPFSMTGEMVPSGEQPDMMTPEDVRAEFSEIGLEVDEPAPRAVIEMKAKRRKEQMIRDDVIARGPGGPLATTLRFGASLAGAAVDPINIASAFVPVVSQARFAGMAAKVGPVQARALTGMTEGLAGAVAVEPMTLALSDELALDYSMTDALVNVALGGLLGGGLHVAGGAVADGLKKRSARLMPEITEAAQPRTLEDALRASVAQTADGKDVTVDPLFREGDINRMAEPGDADAQTAVERAAQDEARAKQNYDIAALREFDESLELPDDLPEPARVQLEEAERLVADADNARPALRAAGECLGR